MMLRADEQFPIRDITIVEIRPRITNEVTQNVFLEVRLAVRRITVAQFIETGQQAELGVARPAVNRVVSPSPACPIRFARRALIDQFTEAGNANFAKRVHFSPATVGAWGKLATEQNPVCRAVAPGKDGSGNSKH